MTFKSKPHAVAQAGVLAGLVAIAAFCIGLLLFIIDLRSVAASAVAAERDLRSAIIARCEARTEYDKRVVRAAEGDAQFYADLLRIVEQTEMPEGTPAEMVENFELQRVAIAEAKARKDVLVAEGVVPGRCTDVYGSRR